MSGPLNWRHAAMCDWERGGGMCSCGLDAARATAPAGETPWYADMEVHPVGTYPPAPVPAAGLRKAICERCGDPIEPGKPHPWIDHLSSAAHRQMLMEDAVEYARQEEEAALIASERKP